MSIQWSAWPGYRAGHRWSRDVVDEEDTVDAGFERYSRPLGLLESGFDVGGQRQGQSDIHALLRVDLEPSSSSNEVDNDALRLDWSNRFLERIWHSWAHLRARHPLLAARIHDGGLETIPGVAAREFVYDRPTSYASALHAAYPAVLLHETRASEQTLDEACEQLLHQHVLNGERTLLDQSECLARLILIRDPASPLKLGLALNVAHVACDALSAFRILRELFLEATQRPLLMSTLPSKLRTLPEHLARAPCVTPETVSPQATAFAAPFTNIALSLPLANEEHYPTIPCVQPSDLAEPSLARRRWFWAFKRTILLRRQDAYPRTLPFPRKALGVDAAAPPQPRTRWPRLRFDRETSAALFAHCKQEGVSPSMLLYAMTTLALAPILAREHPTRPYCPIVIGFPFSSRPFSDPDPPSSHVGTESVSSDPVTDVSLRITFSQIQLPHVSLLAGDGPAQRRKLRVQAFLSARMAKLQFVKMLAADPLSRSLFHAETYGRVLDRLLTMGGANPIAYKRIPTTLNASMIGDVDRLLPTLYDSQRSSASPRATSDGRDSTSSQGDFCLVLHDLRFGTRLHRGEGMLMEAFTWDGMLTVCLGVDDELMRPEDVDALLDGIRKVGRVIADSEIES